jgi:TRAP-type C4-dicarboxylate transport system permease small subunit
MTDRIAAELAEAGEFPEVQVELPPGPLKRAEALLFRIEQTLLVALVAVLVLLAFSKAALAVLFRLGWTWAGDAGNAMLWSLGFTRHLVLIIALVGASLATREGRHLAIDAVSKLLPRRARVLLKAVLDLVSAGVCGLIAKAAYDVIPQDPSNAFSIGSYAVPIWMFMSVVLAGFALIGVRFILRGVEDFWHGWTGRLEAEAPHL